jgi:hypothetical protein
MEFNESLRQEALEKYRKGVYTTPTINGYAAERQLSFYEEKVSHEYFTMQLFQKATTYPEFTLVALFVCTLLFLPHALLFMMMRNKDFSYVASLNALFKKLIEANYAQLEVGARQQLSKFKAFGSTHDISFLQKGNPYLAEPTQITREKISWKELQNRIAKTNTTTNSTLQI